MDSLTKEPMPFVSITLKKSPVGTVTDTLGYFSLNASSNDTIKLSFVGYKSIELPVRNWEASIILMAENTIVLKEVTIRSVSTQHYYRNLFADQHANWQQKQSRSLPFYVSRDKKDKNLVERFKEENNRVKVYMELIASPEFKSDFLLRHKLTEDQFYIILTEFNEKNHSFMYYLTTPELLSLLNAFYSNYKPKK